MPPKIVAAIPARLGSSRFPGKPLALLCGLPMIEHVRRRVQLCRDVADVVVLTCDTKIYDVVTSAGGRAMMTSPAHERASDRVAEFAETSDADIVVMVQGDEPMVVPEMISLALEPLLADPKVLCANLVSPIESDEEFVNPNTIKVVRDGTWNALYFSREPIPTRIRLGFAGIAALKQVCVIPFRRDFLLHYTRLAPTPLEIAESIDMLRAIEHGYPIRLVFSGYPSQSVDVPAELARVEELMQADPLLPLYLR